MNIEKVMEEIKTNLSFASDDIEFKPCAFCGGRARLIIQRPKFGLSGAWVRCCSCGACGPRASINATIVTPDKLITPLRPESLERGIAAAMDAWNSGTVDHSRLGNLRMEGAPA